METHKLAPPSAGLTAAALQDHLSRQLSLSLSDPLSLKRARHVRGYQSCRSRRESRASAQAVERRKTVTLAQRREGGERGGGTGHAKKGGGNGGKVGREEGRERVLDPLPPPLSLAQRLGLVERPQGLLSGEEWKRIKLESQRRQDSTLPCPICQEEFGVKEQVLLSCSHVFHRVCLRSVERFSGKKSCPLCRFTDYQTRLIYEGASKHRIKAATAIQAWWRGERVRRWYRNVRERIPPQDPGLRSRFYQRKLVSLTSKLVESCEMSSCSAESVLAAADSALAAARDAMRILDLHSSQPEPDWTSLRRRATEHISSTECPICLSPVLPNTPSQPPSLPPSLPHRPICLLSCGHLLHSACVQSLEQYCTTDTIPLCPLCRAPYQRQPL